jgi:predicted transposase/invertase (TIGR01784 family)
MEESVFYQGILLEGLTKGKAEGLAKGLAKGKVEASNQIALNMLRSNMAPDLVAQLTGLTLKQVQKLQNPSTKKGQKPKAKL